MIVKVKRIFLVVSQFQEKHAKTVSGIHWIWVRYSNTVLLDFIKSIKFTNQKAIIEFQDVDSLPMTTHNCHQYYVCPLQRFFYLKRQVVAVDVPEGLIEMYLE